MVGDTTSLFDHLVADPTRIVKGLHDADFDLRCLVFAGPNGKQIDVGQDR